MFARPGDMCFDQTAPGFDQTGPGFDQTAPGFD
jgi:hypothetical protein